MTLPNLPEGARLALLNWPLTNSRPLSADILAAANKGNKQRDFKWPAVIYPLLDTGLIERSTDGWAGYRLTQPGRKAVDVLQSGVE
ncbi:MAG: hypothetical protein B7Y35_05945 [Sphingomonadales bacterium 28-64-96]|nr:MAG: hypothetical protein B7Y35_05945 [Sphingomonadales bacterium 28-64-96]